MPKCVSDTRVLMSQIIASTVKNIVMIGTGMAISYPTILIPALLNEENENFNLTKNEVSWIASLQFICVIFGSVASGVLAQCLGRKRCLQVLTVPLCASWLVFTFSNQVWQVYVGLMLNGICPGLVESAVLSYSAEVCQPRVRGLLSATKNLSVIFGIFLQVLLGSFMSWRSAAATTITIPVCAFILLCFVPESPHWLIMRNKLSKAQKSVAWLRGWTNIEAIDEEFQEMCQNIRDQNGTEKDSKTKLSRYFQKNFYWPFALVSFTAFVSTFSGVITLHTFSVSIFRTLRVPINEYHAAMILGLAQFVGSVISIFFVKFCGKRIMALTSMLALAIFECAVGIYVHSKGTNNLILHENATFNSDDTSWIPLILLILVSFVCNCGLKALPWVLLCDVFTHETRAIGCGLFGAIYNSFFFIGYKIFLDMVDMLTFPGVFWLYCCLNFVGAIILYFILPETEGRTLQEIVDHFSGKCKLSNSVKNRRYQ